MIVWHGVHSYIYAAPATPSAGTTKEATNSSKQKQIEDLKERLATKVAELRELQKRAIAGSVKTTSVTTLTIETKTKEVKIELTDDILVYQVLKGKRTKLGADDLEKGDFVVVFGDYDTTLDILKAKVVFIQAALPERLHGTVTQVDTKAFTITVKTPEGRSVTIDIERGTLTNLWNKDTNIVKAGFSKVAVGDTVHIVGTQVPKKENRISADRILDLGNISGVPISVTPTSEVEASPTATLKATPKPSPKKTLSPTPTALPEP